jgi:hypothetical protein
MKASIHIIESQGHGKCVKGGKRTSTVQVQDHCLEVGYLLLKQFRFTVGNSESRDKAWLKASVFAESVK